MNREKEYVAGLLDGNADAETIWQGIEDYEKEYPYDIDVFTLKMLYFMQVDDFSSAIQIGEKAVEKYPYEVKIHEILANACYEQGEYFLAFKHYRIAFVIHSSLGEDEPASINQRKSEEIFQIIDELSLKVNDFLEENEVEEFMARKKSIQNGLVNDYGFAEGRYRSDEDTVGDYFFADGTGFFLGAARAVPYKYGKSRSLKALRGCFLKVREGTDFEIPDGRWIVPCAGREEETNICITLNNQNPIHAIQTYENYFYYYSIDGPARIQADSTICMGEPVPVVHDAGRRKLVLNLFIDGLAQDTISGDRMAEKMPYTSRFFETGVRFENAFCTGDWTFPSIGTYMTSHYTFDHRTFHPILDNTYPEDMHTQAEWFQKAGYHTTLISSDWRIVPSYGCSRGFDQTIYQHMYFGFRADDVIAEVIEQIDSFYETDQFIWATIGDLHSVADVVPCSMNDQIHSRPEDRANTGEGESSVKQKYSVEYKHRYESILRFIDSRLEQLYHFIKCRYRDDEVVVSIFSDHGQGYLVRDNDEFFSDERTNVAFMIKDGIERERISDELVSAVDYLPMMCWLCDVEYEADAIEGVVPKLLGGPGREWCLTESIHPGDPYQAVIHFQGGAFHFINDTNVMMNGLFRLGDFRAYLVDAEGKIYEDEEKRRYCLELIMKHIAPMLVY